MPHAFMMSPGRPGKESILASMLLIAALLLSGVVAWVSIQSARERRSATERSLHDHAEIAAHMLAARTYRELASTATQVIATWRPHRTPVLPPTLICPKGNVHFEAPPQSPLMLGGPPASPSQVRFLTDSLLRNNQGERLLREAHIRLRYVQNPQDLSEGYFIFQRDGVIGVQVCLRDPTMWLRLLQAGPVLPTSITGDLTTDSLLSVAVVAGGQRISAPYESHTSGKFTASALVGADLFGDLAVEVTLKPTLVQRLMARRLPVERTSFILTLLGLSAVLIVVALIHLRREFRLISARSAFIANVSHELRTPLSQILLFTELLSLDRFQTREEQHRAISIIDQEARRLIRLVENVLQFSRAESTRTPLSRVRLDLATHIATTLDLFRPIADAQHCHVLLSVPPGLSCLGDGAAMRQIMLNLLDNAVKYGPPGQVIRITAKAVEEKVRILVEDQGPGIPTSDRERVWEGHYRLPRDAEGPATGTGLGLAVVRTLVRELGGEATVESATGGGARFVIDLPASPQAGA